eukprot:Awhi_evm1s14392
MEDQKQDLIDRDYNLGTLKNHKDNLTQQQIDEAIWEWLKDSRQALMEKEERDDIFISSLTKPLIERFLKPQQNFAPHFPLIYTKASYWDDNTKKKFSSPFASQGEHKIFGIVTGSTKDNRG